MEDNTSPVSFYCYVGKKDIIESSLCISFFSFRLRNVLLALQVAMKFDTVVREYSVKYCNLYREFRQTLSHWQR